MYEWNCAGTPGQLVTESDDVSGMTQPGHPLVAAELTLRVASGNTVDTTDTVGILSDSVAADLHPSVGASVDNSSVDEQ